MTEKTENLENRILFLEGFCMGQQSRIEIIEKRLQILENQNKEEETNA